MNSAYESDHRLLAATLLGDETAFRAFFDTYYPRVYQFALRRLNSDAEAAREVAQATVSQSMCKLHSYRGEAALFSWMCQICRHQIVDYLHASRRHKNVVLIDDSPWLRAALDSAEGPSTADPEHAYGVAETQHFVHSVLDRLPSRYGDALEWKYIEGCSVAQISARLGVGRIAAQSLLARARAALRQGLVSLQR